MQKRRHMNMDTSKKPVAKWVKYLIVLAIGILMIVAGAIANSGADDAMSIVVGVVLMVFGVAFLFAAFFLTNTFKRGFLFFGIPGAFLVLVAVSLFVEKWFFDIITFFLLLVPYLLLAIGFALIADAILKVIHAKGNAGKAILILLPEMILALAALVLGILCLKINNGQPVIPQTVQLIILGVIVCVYAVYEFLLTVIKLPKAVAYISVE